MSRRTFSLFLALSDRLGAREEREALRVFDFEER